jgi:peptidoglycan/LPS O-acetylase OafA/YrhL
MKLNYVKPLDGLRASAILLVLVWHYFACQINENLFNGAAKYLKLATSWTWSGVDLFFVLSGFLIGRILIHYKGSPNYFKTFYVRRIFRIFPPYYLVLIVFVIIALSGLSVKMPWLSNDAYPFYSYFLYLQNFWMHTNHGAMWLGVTWSLAIEEQFYCILPLLIFFVNLKSLPKFLIGGIVLAPICRLFIPDLGAYVLLPARMDSLLIGVLIAYYYLNGSLQKTFENKGAFLLKLLAAFIFLLLCSLVLFIKGIGKEGIGGVFTHSILACIYGTLLIFVLVNNHSFLS